MGRPSDWWVLDLDRDPVPGEPWSVRSLSRSWSGLADDAEWAQTRVRQLLGEGTVGAWIGEAGDAFRAKTGDLPEQLGRCKESYRLASEALEWWAGRLDGHQGDADAALVKGRAARADLEAAQAQAAAAAAAVQSAAGSSVLREARSPVVDPALMPSPEQVRDARARFSSAQARLDAARQLALDAGSLRDGDAQRAAGRIHEAADAGIPERSRWERFKDWAGEAWDVVVTIAKVVVAVLGIVALVIGGPLAWVVFAAAVLVLVDTIAKYVQGQASLWDVAFSALACIPGTKGLTSLAALRTAFRSGGALGAGLHVATSARTAVVEIAQAVRTASTALRTTTVAFAAQASLRYSSHIKPVMAGLSSMAHPRAFGVLGTLKRVPEVLRIPAPQAGDEVYRVFGPALDAQGARLVDPATGYPMGSRAGGASWTPADPRSSSNLRVEAGLPDENPASFFVEGAIVDPREVPQIRLALPLDGNPGGWPEYLISNTNIVEGGGSVAPTAIGGVNESWTTGPGGWTPPARH
jgi:hypothetical protein